MQDFGVKMGTLLIDKPEHRERLLKACRDYKELRKGTLSLGQENKPTETEPMLFDGIFEGHKE